MGPVSPHGVPGGDTGRAGQSGRYAETWGWPFGASRRAAWTPEGTEGSLQETVVQNSSATSLVRPCSGMGSVGPGRWVLCPSRGGLEVSLGEADTTGTPHGLGWGQATGAPRGRVSPRAAARFSGPSAFVILSPRHCLPGEGELRVSVGRCPAFLDLLPVSCRPKLWAVGGRCPGSAGSEEVAQGSLPGPCVFCRRGRPVRGSGPGLRGWALAQRRVSL